MKKQAPERFKNLLNHPQYIPPALDLYGQWHKYLEDDFTNCIEITPFFWAVTDSGRFACDNDTLPAPRFAGLVYLENIFAHKAEINVCFVREYWGDYVRESAELFFDFCFNTLGFKKLKALIYPQNFRVKTLLRQTGFKKEGCLLAETIKNGKPQDIEIYAKKSHITGLKYERKNHEN